MNHYRPHAWVQVHNTPYGLQFTAVRAGCCVLGVTGPEWPGPGRADLMSTQTGALGWPREPKSPLFLMTLGHFMPYSQESLEAHMLASQAWAGYGLWCPLWAWPVPCPHAAPSLQVGHS